MGIGRGTLGLALLAVAGCGSGAPAADPSAAGLHDDPVLRAVAVWENGAEGIPPPPPPLSPPEEEQADLVRPEEAAVEEPTSVVAADDEAPFRDFDPRVRRFLVSPYVDDAVQFSCVSQPFVDEDWVTAGLDDKDPEVRLRALVVMVRARAPRTVDRQWAVLDELRTGPRAVEFAQVTTRVETAFAPAALDRTLAEPPPGTEYSTPAAYQWALRAAGVTRHRDALARLAELSRADQLDVSLAAERSLEDFTGPEADAALARCVDGWQYNAAMKAAGALLKRDPERLRATLLASEPPVGQVYWKGIFLAHLEDRRGVPILCEEVPGLRRSDASMFDAIERLAGPEDLESVEALPGRVRDDQRPRAEEVVAAVRLRLAGGR
jgi:hypothetical protein